jgi:hypothetical protein
MLKWRRIGTWLYCPCFIFIPLFIFLEGQYNQVPIYRLSAYNCNLHFSIRIKNEEREVKFTMEEREFYTEKDETFPASINCPKCKQIMEYQIRWRRRTRKASVPPNANEQDRAKFAKLRNYRIRLDDKLRCKNPRCGKTIEISTLQTVVFD